MFMHVQLAHMQYAEGMPLQMRDFRARNSFLYGRTELHSSIYKVAKAMTFCHTNIYMDGHVLFPRLLVGAYVSLAARHLAIWLKKLPTKIAFLLVWDTVAFAFHST